jgi:predicted Zn finger-like uncharacterized protein
MLIVCPSCASEYTIDPANLGAHGRTVRCALCRDSWFVASPRAETAGQADAAAAPASEGDAGPVPPRSRGPVRRLVGPIVGLLALATAGLAGFGQHLPHPVGRWIDAAQQGIVSLRSAGPADLVFSNVASELVMQGNGAVLVVTGEIANPTGLDAIVPHLEFWVRNEDEQVLATWTSPPPRPTLGPGEAARFETRSASPPPGGRQVRVHFTAAGGIAFAARSPDL